MSDLKSSGQILEIPQVKSESIKVLLIEDNPGDARLVKEMLADADVNRFKLKHEMRVREGLSLLNQEDFHVVLLDLSLPDGEGLETVRQVCSAAPRLPIIILTGLDDETFAFQTVQWGAQDYLIKGQMDSNLLTRAIRYAIERKRSEQSLRESEERFRQLAENIRDVFYICKEDMRQKFYISPAYEDIWGRTCESFYQEPHFFWEAVHPEDKDRVFSSSKARSQQEVEEIYRIVRPDGSVRWIKDRSFPIQDDSGKTYRIVGIAEDITSQKQGEEQLKYLSLYDPLTGLHNRLYFEEELSRIEKSRYESVGIISCDLDGLKLVNDTFGHAFGDKLLSAAAKVLTGVFRGGDLVARIGGDEFSVILPNTPEPVIREACQRIQDAILKHNAGHPELPLSISVGFAIKNGVPIDIRELFKEADNNMYREKLHHSQSVRSNIVQTLLKTLNERDFITEEHARRLEKLLVKGVKSFGLLSCSLTDLRLVAKFHDIGKIGVPDHILLKKGPLTPDEWTKMKRHCEIGYRIALSSPDLIPIADWVLKHHEWWNGQGYPLGLKGEEIPIECRILSVANAYEALTRDRPYRKAFSHEEALGILKSESGTQFDPEILERFLQMLKSDPPDSESEGAP